MGDGARSLTADASILPPYVASMAVDQAHRRNGIGADMIAGAERVAREWGYASQMFQ